MTNISPNLHNFPENFRWGVATSAYQIEGAHDVDGRGPSVWDKFCHEDPENIQDRSNGDVTCDSYKNYKEDVRLIKNLGARVYRFSISWSRILPNGTKSAINTAGIDYYNRLIDELLKNSIEPMVTLFHWDTPAALQDDWLNENTVTHFADYARICFQNFGDRVKSWITLNEPRVYSIFGYTMGIFAPGKKDPMTSSYICGHNQLKAHALAYHMYDTEFRPSQNGKIGISLDSDGFEAFDKNCPQDCDATERAYQFNLGWFAHPIFNGDYPSVMKELVKRRSNEEGRKISRLPEFNDEWIQKIKGSADFLGINNYTTRLVKHRRSKVGEVGLAYEHDGEILLDPNWKHTEGVSWLHPVPWGLRKLLNWAAKEYGVEMMVTENGMGTTDPQIDDEDRIDFYNQYLKEVLKAIVIDGNNVTGYTAWCLSDNFEWASGFSYKFGIHSVDFDTPERTRTPRASAKFLEKIFRENKLPNE